MHKGINNSHHVFLSPKIHFWHAISPKNPGEDISPYKILEVLGNLCRSFGEIEEVE